MYDDTRNKLFAWCSSNDDCDGNGRDTDGAADGTLRPLLDDDGVANDDDDNDWPCLVVCRVAHTRRRRVIFCRSVRDNNTLSSNHL